LLLGKAGGLRTGQTVQQIFAGGVVLLLLLFSAQRGETVEEQLAKVGQGDGVLAGDAFASELFNEIAEEEIDFIGGGEVFDGTQKFGGDGFGVWSGTARSASVCVVGAEGRALLSIQGTVILVNQHVTTAAFQAYVLAAGIVVGTNRKVVFGGHG
jgi:hypothetical protein